MKVIRARRKTQRHGFGKQDDKEWSKIVDCILQNVSVCEKGSDPARVC